MDGYHLMSLNAAQLLEPFGNEFSFGRSQSATLFDEALH